MIVLIVVPINFLTLFKTIKSDVARSWGFTHERLHQDSNQDSHCLTQTEALNNFFGVDTIIGMTQNGFYFVMVFVTIRNNFSDL